MPLIDEVPPSKRPRGCGRLRLPLDSSGSVENPQVMPGIIMAVVHAAGTETIRWLSRPPASSSSTLADGSSDNLLARTHPAEPAPMTMKS